MQDLISDPLFLAKVVVAFAAISVFMRGQQPGDSAACPCNKPPAAAAVPNNNGAANNISNNGAAAAPNSNNGAVNAAAMQVSDVANPMVNAGLQNRDKLAVPTGQIVQGGAGTIANPTIAKPAQAPADFKGTQNCTVGEPSQGDDAMMNAAELFPKKVDDAEGFDTLGVGEVDTAQQLDGVFPDSGATLETTWNQSSDLRGDCAVEACSASDPFGGTMMSSHHCGFKDGKAVRSTIY